MKDRILNLKKTLSQYSTIEILGMLSLRFSTFSDGEQILGNEDLPIGPVVLMSPFKQNLYLAGLLMSTPEESCVELHRQSKNTGSSKFHELDRTIQEITSEYVRGFLVEPLVGEGGPTQETRTSLTQNLAALDAFVSYFDTGPLRFEEQTVDLIRTIYLPFDNEFEAITELSIEDCLSFYFFVQRKTQQSVNAVFDIFKKQDAFLASLQSTCRNRDEFEQKILSYRKNNFEQIRSALDNQNQIGILDINSEFGESKTDRLLSLFSIRREQRDFIYYNDNNPFTAAPLCWVSDQKLFVVSSQLLINAIFERIASIIGNPSNSFHDAFVDKRGRIVEDCFLNVLKNLFGTHAKFHLSVCESPGTDEHDIIVEHKDCILVCEVKSSKIRAPLFNPERSYPRIRDDFNSSSGIGYAYKQAISLIEMLSTNESVQLYENMNQSFTIHDTNKKRLVPVVLTLSQYGGIAVNTSYLMEAQSGNPYPWVCNLHDFQNIERINRYLGKSLDDFLEYVFWRVDKHKDIHASDELDIIEAYYTKPDLRMETDPIFIMPNVGINLIDKIYYEEKGVPCDYMAGEYETKRLTSAPSTTTKKIGRNAPCPCGSGVKYKRCCLKRSAPKDQSS